MIDEVLAYWFGEPAKTTEEYGRQIKRWFMGGEAIDVEIRARFAGLVEQAIAGELDGWAKTLRGRLALILLLDQFTRSVHRDQPEMYAGDARAQQLATDALDRGLEDKLPAEQRHFLVMPLMHAEDLALQDRAVAAIRACYDAALEWQKPMLAMGIEQSEKYRDVIARFGRFPHRNSILGRANTPDEDEFLRDWKSRQAPTGANDL